MKGKKKMKYSIIQRIERKQMRSGEMKGKQRNLETESCLTASYERGNKGEITVYSTKFVTNNLLTNPDFKICSLTASQITKVKIPFLIFKKSGNYSTCKISRVNGY